MSHASSPADASQSNHSSNSLTLWIVVAIVIAIALSIALPKLGLMGLENGTDSFAVRHQTLTQFFDVIAFGGEIFLRLLKMMVVPLVIVSVMSGVLGMGDIRKLGRPGIAACVYFLSTTVMAVVLGLILVNVIKPGIGTLNRDQAESMAFTEEQLHERLEDQEKGEALEEGSAGILRKLVLLLFTDNLFKSMVDGQLLPLIVFSIVFAGMLTTMGERVDTIKTIISQANHAILAFVLLLMKVAPLGIFCLVAGRFGKEMLNETFLHTLQLVSKYSFTVLLGLAIHTFGTLPLILWVRTRRNPYKFMWAMSQSLLTAFSTSSSSATLPVTLECVTDRGNVSRKSADFVVPLGATINMDGTALYEAVAALFIAQFLWTAGLREDPLSLSQQAVVAVTATLAAIGAAGIPEAGLVTMLIVLDAVGLPIKYQAVIIPVDWLLDRFRTVTNVWGDAVGSAVVDPLFPPDEPVFGPTPVEDPTPGAQPI